jgi:hypothetical protein
MIVRGCRKDSQRLEIIDCGDGWILPKERRQECLRYLNCAATPRCIGQVLPEK